MIPVRQGFRVLHIAWVLLRHGLDEFILAAHLFRPIRFFRFLSPFYLLQGGRRPNYGVRIRRTLEDLGPIYVKFGQILSTRRDLLPDEIAEELIKLQDQVPPFPGEQALALIEKGLGKPITELFAHFDSEPLASASIAQVHSATLPDGTEVVIKVVRPNIDKTIRRDVDLMFTIARLAQKYSILILRGGLMMNSSKTVLMRLRRVGSLLDGVNLKLVEALSIKVEMDSLSQ